MFEVKFDQNFFNKYVSLYPFAGFLFLKRDNGIAKIQKNGDEVWHYDFFFRKKKEL